MQKHRAHEMESKTYKTRKQTNNKEFLKNIK